uniref:2'-5'-oligoadenylate synthetase 1 domain-containing protein n=1 Tax=Felis catus TaxID=9685 RepID=A0ABI7XUH5_FELCA
GWNLKDIPAGNLDKFIEDYLLPDTRFRRQVRQAIHIISTFLKERCFQDAPHPVRVSKVVKCKEKLGKPLPPQYALELLTVYAWERGNKQTDFSTARGFQTVLVLVLNYRELCIYWTNYYDFENPIIKQYLRRQLNKSRPVILDPADPTGNVAGKDRYSWQRLAEEARVWLGYPCFTNRDGSQVVSWNVQPEEDYPNDWFTCEHRTYQYHDYGWRPEPCENLSTGLAASIPQKEDDWTCAIL